MSLSSVSLAELAPLAQSLLPTDVAEMFCRPDTVAHALRNTAETEKTKVPSKHLHQVQNDMDAFLRDVVVLMDQVRDKLCQQIEEKTHSLLVVYQHLNQRVLQFMEQSLDLVRK